jgi:hypothetical protein
MRADARNPMVVTSANRRGARYLEAEYVVKKPQIRSKVLEVYRQPFNIANHPANAKPNRWPGGIDPRSCFLSRNRSACSLPLIPYSLENTIVFSLLDMLCYDTEYCQTGSVRLPENDPLSAVFVSLSHARIWKISSCATAKKRPGLF